ncbi:ParB/RepB/Spo0J family partition protein [Patescibacteria group bacterium]|nr:ParB/RepB/Spo0J family partition protein [Patescibacteria group bacterium]
MSDGNVLTKEAVEKARQERGSVRTLFVEKVRPWSDQPRKHFNKKAIQALGESINQVGQKVPISVMVDPKDPEYFSINDGERRWLACRWIGRKVIQAIVLPNEEEDERLIRSVVANFGREGHTPYEVALAIRRIHAKGKYNVNQIAAMFAKSNCWVYQHLSLTKLDPRVVAMMDYSVRFEERLKFAIAILLTALPGDLQFAIAKETTEKKMRMKTARHYVEIKAAEAGLKVGGIASRPERRRGSLISLLTVMKESLPAFLKAPDISLNDFLSAFSYKDLVKIGEQTEECCKSMKVISDTVKAVKQIKTKEKKALNLINLRRNSLALM